MPRYLALEWDQTEARAVVAQPRGSVVEVLHALRIDLSGLAARSPAEIGKHIREALIAANISASEVHLAVGRSNLELRVLGIPPVPAEELSDLVRFQASRQFSQSLDEAKLDFTPLLYSGNPPTSVLAAAIPGDAFKSIMEACVAAELKPLSLALRPFAVSSLLMQRASSDACTLAIDLLAADADLTVFVGEQAVFPRTVRLGTYEQASELATALVLEARRTIAAAQNQLAGKKVSQVVLFGAARELELHVELLAKELRLPVQGIDPWDQVEFAGSGTRVAVEHSGRFAPLLGMMKTATRGERPPIDFLAPRKRPAPPDYSRLYALATTAAASLVLVCALWLWWSLRSQEEEIQRVRDEITKIDTLLKTGKSTLEHTKWIDEFSAGQIAWIEEFGKLAEKLPPADRILVGELRGSALNAGGRLMIEGGGKDAADIDTLETTLRDAVHRVARQRNQRDDFYANYPWHFEESITIAQGGASASRPVNTKPATNVALQDATANSSAGKEVSQP